MTAALRSSRLDAFLKPAVLSDTGINGKVLIAGNQPEVASLLAYCLTAAGFRTRVSESVADGVREVGRFFPDLVLLDSRAPDFGSTELWRQIRAGGVSADRQPAVVMFIRNEDDIDPRLGLAFGPCDFVLYPFCVRDLVLRVDGIIRARYTAGKPAKEPSRRRHYLVGPLELDVDKHVILVQGAAVQVSSLQMRVVTDLVRAPGPHTLPRGPARRRLGLPRGCLDPDGRHPDESPAEQAGSGRVPHRDGPRRRLPPLQRTPGGGEGLASLGGLRTWLSGGGTADCGGPWG